MEILSIGEKIKRARIHKGYTLKDVCKDKVSVSKMSCIENDKIPPESWIIEYISSELDLDMEYLKCDIKTQIGNNIKKLKNYKESADYEDKLKYNLSFASKYDYYDEAFYIMHLLFLYNIEQKNFEKLQALIPGYYEISVKSSLEENQLEYYMDIGKYLYKSKEYVQSASYYNMVRNSVEKKNYIMAKAILNECKCYIKLKNREKIYELEKKLLDVSNYFKRDSEKAEIYSILAILSIKNNMYNFEKYKLIAYDLYGEEVHKKAKATYDFAIAMLDVGLKDKGVEYIKRGLEYYPENDLNKLTGFMLVCLDKLINNNAIEECEIIIEDVVNYSINTQNIEYIEKAYYYKAILMEKKQNMKQQELYMNLSLDALMKFGKKEDLYKRYIDVGNMYFNMNNIKESIKYFNLAVKVKEKI